MWKRWNKNDRWTHRQNPRVQKLFWAVETIKWRVLWRCLKFKHVRINTKFLVNKLFLGILSLYVESKKQNKQIKNKQKSSLIQRTGWWFPEEGVRWGWNWVKGIKRYKLAVLNKPWDVTYGIAMVNNTVFTVLNIWELLREWNLKSSHQRNKPFCSYGDRW